MKIDIDTLRDTFKISYETFRDSRDEAREILNYYHNRQFTEDQIEILRGRGQPAETFNIIKTFGRMLVGYYSTVVNTIKVVPSTENDIITAGLLNDIANYIMRTNNFNMEGDKIKLDAILTGLAVAYIDVVKTGDKDEFNRPKYKIELTHVPSMEVLIDPMSKKDDYSDAKYIHRYKWISEEDLKALYGKKASKLLEYYNHLNIEDTEFTTTYFKQFTGETGKLYKNFLVVHSIVIDDNGKSWSIHWCEKTILDKKEITYKEVKNPYRIVKLNSSDKAEYYGIFREVVRTQDAINQAIIKIQMLVNTNKVFVEENAITDFKEFSNIVNSVNAVIPVKSLQGIKVENMSADIADQYRIIHEGLERIQRILCINDSFLGMAYASDSGAKVKLQQNASSVALRYLTSKIEQFYRLIGIDVINLVKQYFTAHEAVRIADNYNGHRWLELNKPMVTERTGSNGEIYLDYIYEEVIDPASGEPMVDDNGNFIVAPIPTSNTDIAFTNADVEVESVSYNDEDEKNNELFQQFLAGVPGNILSQINPAGYLQISALMMRNIKSKFSPDIANVLEQTAASLNSQMQNPPMQQAMQLQNQSNEKLINKQQGR